MKLERLHVKAFGGFDDHVLDLSGGKQGFHLIYGANEAGKSTTLRAITQLLYGIESRTSDDFLHPMKALRIGATLQNETDALTFFRRKGNKATLLAADDKTPLPDDVLASFLGGVDEENFKHLFGLSHEQLVRGGEALVQGEGDVGQALFSAAAGMGSLKQVLDRLEFEAGALFKASGSKPRINHGLSQLRAVRKRIRETQLRPQEWDALVKQREEAGLQHDALLESLKALGAEQSRLERVGQALPLVSKRLEVLERLAVVADAALLPDDFRERRIAALHASAGAREQHQVSEANLSRLASEMAALEVDEALLGQEARIESLNGRHLVCLKAQEDKQRTIEPDLRQDQAKAKKLLRALKCDVALDEVEALRPAPGIKERINELAQAFQANEKDKAHALAQQQKLEAEIKRCQDDLSALGDPPETSALAKAIQEAHPAASLEAEHTEREAAAAQLTRRIDDALARLVGWSGTAEALDVLAVPAASTIERFRIQLEEEQAEARRWIEEGRALEKERGELETQLDAFQRAQHVPTEADLAAQRTAREAGWQMARHAWESGVHPDDVVAPGVQGVLQEAAGPSGDSANLAEAVERLTRRADETADRLRRESDRAAAVAQLESSRDAITGKLERLAQQRCEGQERHGLTQAAWAAEWAGTNVAPRSPAEMAEWRSDYRAIAEDIRRLREEEVAFAAHEATVDRHRASLLRVLEVAHGTEKAPLLGGAGGGSILTHKPKPTPNPSEEGNKKTLATPATTCREPLGEDTATAGLAFILECAEARLEQGRAHQQAYQQQTAQLAQWENDTIAVEQVLARVRLAEATWGTEWAESMASIGARPDASPAEARVKLDVLTDLFTTLDATTELEARIAQIDREYEEYLAAVADLAHAAATELVDHPHDILVPALYQQLKVHRDRAIQQVGLQKQHSEEQARLAEAEAALERADSELTALCAQAQVDSVEALEAAELRAQQRGALTEELRALEARLLEVSPGLSLEAFLANVAAEDADAVATRLTAIGPDVETAEDERDRLNNAIGKLDHQLEEMDGSDEAAVLAGEAQNLLAAIADDAREYARLKVASVVLSQAIERYRAANQEPLLARASAIFTTLTLGSFHELRADYNEKGTEQVLCGVRADNNALVHIAGMSEGTADQLYLALRLASLERHLEKRPPIPFILDDILVNFDDQRAAATLKVLGELSRQTQVIYFTHHQHLVALAKKNVKKSQLFTHDLGK